MKPKTKAQAVCRIRGNTWADWCNALEERTMDQRYEASAAHRESDRAALIGGRRG